MGPRAAVILFIILAPTLRASIATTALQGRVTVDGRPVANVTVTATSQSLQHPRTAVTGKRGTYWISGLPPGVYALTFSGADMEAITRLAIVRIAQVTRVDAQFDIPITTHRTAEDLRRLPVYGDARAFTYATAGVNLFNPGPIETDDFLWLERSSAETIEEGTLIRAAQPIEIARGDGSALRVATRSGSDHLSISVRDSISSLAWVAGRLPGRFETNDIEHFLEGAAGGPIVRERLWFFAGLWLGDRPDDLLGDLRGGAGKLTVQIGGEHNVVIEHLDAQRSFLRGLSRHVRESATFVRHTAQWSPSLLSEIVAGRESQTAKVTSVAGNHVLSGGVEIADDETEDIRFAFINDRWIGERWTVIAGLGHDEDRMRGQLAAAYDLRGDGHHALSMSFSRYAETDEATISFASGSGTSRWMRIAAIRRDTAGVKTDSVQLEGTYHFSDRLRAGANYTYYDVLRTRNTTQSQHVFSAWINGALPVGGHLLSATVVQRYEHGLRRVNFSTRDEYASTDVAVRYMFPIARVATTIAADVLHVLDREKPFEEGARTLRLWVRVSM